MALECDIPHSIFTLSMVSFSYKNVYLMLHI